MILQPGLAPVMEGGTDRHRDLHELLCRGGGGRGDPAAWTSARHAGGGGGAYRHTQRLTRVAV